MFWIIIIACLVIDQLTKLLVVSTMQLYESIPLIDNVFQLTYVLNDGASFSILQGGRWVFIVVTIVTLALIFYLLRFVPREMRLLRGLVAVFIGGTLGNFIDRLTQGAVIDFLDFCLINFPVFNFADCCITVSIVLICLRLLFGREKHLLEDKK